MKVKVMLPSYVDRKLLDSNNCIELADDATLGDLLKLLNLPPGLMTPDICCVNSHEAQMDTILKEGDKVSFILLLAGG